MAPLTIRTARLPLDLSQAFERAAVGADDLVWLDSVRRDPGRGDRSMLVLQCSPRVLVRAGELRQEGRECVTQRLVDAEAQFARACEGDGALGLGWVGFASYESAAIFDSAFALSDAVAADDVLLWCAEAQVVARDCDGEVELLCSASSVGEADAAIARWCRILSEPVRAYEAPARFGAILAPGTTSEDYARAFGAAHEAIARGDVYQVCLTYPIELHGDVDLALEYLRLRRPYGGDYSAYVRAAGVELASLSPERFLRVRGRRVEARPMKGTRAVSGDAAVDAERAAELAASVKERAENVMIVDLLRNDLGRVCEVGSIGVPQLFEVEQYRTVLQLTSTIAGTLRSEVGPFGLLAATFPPGSMTGAPKIAACRLLAGLEPQPRRLYSGTVFWLGYDGAWDFSVVIRSLQRTPAGARWDTGGGIVADSTLDAEWEETRLKASPVLRGSA